MYDLINYYSAINNSLIIQFTDNLRHILLVHDVNDDFLLFFFVLFCYGACLCVYAELV